MKTTTTLAIILLLALLTPQALADEHTEPVCEPVTEIPDVESFQVPVQVRDFNKSHVDFQNVNQAEKGIVEETLGEDGLPVYAHGPTGETSDTTHGNTTFDQWYRDVEGVNIPLDHELTFTRTGQGTYTYQNDSYFPIDDQGYGNTTYEGFTTEELGETWEDGDVLPHNYHFTTELHFNFTYRGGEELSFTGDDDLWVFINEQLIIDLGGVHSAQTKTITLDETTAQEYSLTTGETYPIDIFHAERHWWRSEYELTLGGFEIEYEKCEEVQTQLTCQEPTPTLNLQQAATQTINYQDLFAGDLRQAIITSQSPQDIIIEEQEEQASITNINHNTSTTLQFKATTADQSITCPVQATASTQGGVDYCQLESFSFEQTTPNVYLYVDESGSMGWDDDTDKTRRERAQEGLQQLTPLAQQANIGFGGFSRACSGTGLNHYLNMSTYSEEEFSSAIQQIKASGSTPMHAAVIDAREKNRLENPLDPFSEQREKYLILIGDGEPNSCGCQNYQSCEQGIADEIRQLREEQGVQTFIIGFNFNEDIFNDFAQAGGTENPFDDYNDYFRADDAATLVTAFEKILQSIECRVPLQHKPQYEQGIHVYFNDEQLPADTWTYDAEGNAIVLEEATCAAFEEQEATMTVGSQCVDAPTCVEPTPQIIFGEADTRSVEYTELFEGNLDYFEMSWQEPTGVTVEEHTSGQGVNVTNNDAEENTQIPFTYAHPDNAVTCSLDALLTINEVEETDPNDPNDPDETQETPTTGLQTCNSEDCKECKGKSTDQEVLTCLENNNCYNKEQARPVYNQPTTIQTHQLVESLPGAYETRSISTIGNFSINPSAGENRHQGYTLQHQEATDQELGALIAVIEPHGYDEIQICQQLKRLNYNLESPPNLIQSPLLVVGTRAFTDLLGEKGPHLFSAKVWVP